MRITWLAAALVIALYFVLPVSSSGQVYPYTIDTAVGQYPFGDGGPPAEALLAWPSKIAIDNQGAVYIADAGNNKIRKVASGQITSFAGTGIPGFSGDGGLAANAQLSQPSGVAVDSAGNVYIYDTGNEVIRKVDANGIVSTFAGTPLQSGSSGDGGPAIQARLNLGGDGNLVVDPAGDVYFSDEFNAVVRKVTAGTGIVTTVAGTMGKPGSAGDGGPATSANLSDPAGLAFDLAGNLYIADSGNDEIRKVSATNGTITTVAGIAPPLPPDMPLTAALFFSPEDVALDAADNLYIADFGDGDIRKLTAGAYSTISNFAGSDMLGYSGDGGLATAAELLSPSGVALDRSGTLYIADDVNNRIRTVRNGFINEFAGASHAQGDGGEASAALLYFPERLAWDKAGNLYIADTENNRIRKVTTGGKISTIAGTGSYLAFGDTGPAIVAGVPEPQAVAVDSSGNVFIASENQIRKIDGNGDITTVVNASNTGGFSGDGAPAAAARLCRPQGLTVDSAGDLYIADALNNRVRKVSGGNIATVAGSGPACLHSRQPRKLHRRRRPAPLQPLCLSPSMSP